MNTSAITQGTVLIPVGCSKKVSFDFIWIVLPFLWVWEVQKHKKNLKCTSFATPTFGFKYTKKILKKIKEKLVLANF